MNLALKQAVSGLMIVVVAGLLLTSCGKSQQEQVKETTVDKKVVSQTAKATGDIKLLLETGEKHFSAGEITQAVECFEKVQSVEPNNVTANTKLGILYPVIGKNEESVACYKKVLEVEPENLEVLVYLTATYRALKQNDLAITSLEKAKELAKTQKPELVDKIDVQIKKMKSGD